MEKKNIININESHLHNIVNDVVKTILKEGWVDNAKNTIKKGFNNIRQRYDDEMDNMERRYDIKNSRPESFAEVFKGNGWEIRKTENIEGENRFYATQVIGLDGVPHGLNAKKLVDDLNVMAEDLGLTPNCRCLGKLQKYPNVFVFTCPFED